MLFLLSLKLKFLISNLGGGERQLGIGRVKKAKKIPEAVKNDSFGDQSEVYYVDKGYAFNSVVQLRQPHLMLLWL